jgi:hypothetical protein
MEPLTPGQAFKNLKDSLLHGELATDWRKPRTSLPGFGYLRSWYVAWSSLYVIILSSILLLSVGQIVYAYYSGTGFDVKSEEFIGPALIFIVAAYGAAGQLRRITMAHSIRRQAKQQVVIAEYKTDLSPVEVGVMLDAVSDDNEIAGTVLQLLNKGVLEIVESDTGPVLRQKGNTASITEDEAVFVQELFKQRPVSLYDNGALRQAGREMSRQAFERMVNRGYIPLLSGWEKLNYFVVEALSYAGFILSIFILPSIFFTESYLINYPRYPIYFWEVLLALAQIAILIVVPLQAYFADIFSKAGMEKYREAAGLYMFMSTVYRERVKAGTLSQSELDYYLPYAYAFGFEEAVIDDPNTSTNKV